MIAARLATLVGVLVLVAGLGWVIAAQQSTLSRIEHQQHAARESALNDTRILQLVEGAVGPKATAKSQANLQHLIACLENHIDVANGIGVPMAGCP